MIKLLIEKELKNIIGSSRFIASFITFSILIIMSVSIGIIEYKANYEQYLTGKNLAIEEMKTAKNWMGVSNKIFREPDVMQVFVSGTHYDVGRYSSVSKYSESGLVRSPYSDNTLFAIFRQIDFATIVTVVFSLLAILFTYNSVCGEKEDGTLRLVFSNSIPRSHFIISKFVGSLIGLILPVLIPILISLLLVMVFGVPLKGSDWFRVGMLILSSLVYFGFFIAAGVFVSSTTRKSSVSFLILLSFWIFVVYLMPRLGILAASGIVNVPTSSEIQSKKEAFATVTRNESFKQMSELYQDEQEATKGMNDSEKQAYRESKEWEMMEKHDKIQKDVDAKIAANSKKLDDELINKRNQMHKLALIFSRISPVSAYQLMAMNLANTNINLKENYESQIRDYRNKFMDFTDKKLKENPGSGMFTITFDSQSGMKLNQGRKESTLDISQVPQFNYNKSGLSTVFVEIIPDLLLLMIFLSLSIVGGFFSFYRYDLR